MIGMVAINIVIGQGARMGWLSPTILALVAVAIASLYAFVRIEKV